ncbi:Aspartic protease PEP3, partial [Tolypocladium ophioglossoides CBS 100239]
LHSLVLSVGGALSESSRLSFRFLDFLLYPAWCGIFWGILFFILNDTLGLPDLNMQSTTLISFLLVSLLALVSAAPSAIQKRSFTVERVANPSFTGRNGPMALAKTYRKFRMPLPQGLVNALAAQSTKRSEETSEETPNLSVTRRVFRHFDRSDRSRRGVAALANSGLGGSIGGRVSLAGVGRDGSSLVPRQQAGKNGTNQTGTVKATPENNAAEFLSQVRIGGQKLNLDFDTGSSDLWVFNTQLTADATTGHRVYDPTQSKSFAMIAGAQFRISYGDGSGAEGNVGIDVVDVGGASVQAQPIELATAVTDTFVEDQNTDGLMGLAFSSLNTVKPQKQKTFFENVMPSLNEPLFTANLRKGGPGAYTFGAVDKSKFQGDLTWIPVNNTNGFWQFSSEKFAVNGEATQPATPGGQAIADTGTTLILADRKIVQGYYAKVQGAQDNQTVGGITVPCNAKLPDLDLDIGGKYMARIAGIDINFAQVGGGNCFGGLQASPPGTPGIYGDIFFKSQFVAFNGGNNTLGMAPHA